MDEQTQQGASVSTAVGQHPAIVARGLCLKTLRVKAYEKVSLEVAAGETCALLGEDGSGKSELLLSLAGRIRPTSGSLSVLGHDGTTLAGMAQIRRHAALGIFAGVNEVQRVLRVRTIASAELGLAGHASGRAATRAFLAEHGLAEVADEQVGSLSAPLYHRLGVALALAHDPEVLVVEDIESHMTERQSLEAADALARVARERGIAVVVGCTDADVALRLVRVVCLTPSARTQLADICAAGAGQAANAEVTANAAATTPVPTALPKEVA